PLEVAHQEHAPDLCHRLDDEHPGHDRMSRKMPLEERLVDRHVLDADDPLLPFHLDDPVHEQERIAMRQDVHDAADVHLGRAATSLVNPKVRAGASSRANACGVTVKLPAWRPISGCGHSMLTVSRSSFAGATM